MFRTGRFSFVVKIAWVAASFVVSALRSVASDCLPPPSGLVAWWPGEGDASDLVGGHFGTAYGGVSFASGEVGQAFSFDGSSGHIRVPDRPDLRFTTGMTVESWINPSDLSGFGSIVVKWDAFLGPNQMAFTFSLVPGGQLSLGVSADGTPNRLAAVTSANTLSIGQWSHVAGTYDGQALRIYINGALVAQVSYNQGIFPGTDDLAIGGVVGGETRGQVISPFAGLIDEPSLYSHALTAAEILAIYNAGVAGKCKTPVPPLIVTQPADQTVIQADMATFKVVAAGTQPLSYQWSFNDTDIAGATSASLVLTNVQTSQAGTYAVLVTNAFGAVLSSNVVLTVNPAPACAMVPPGLVAWWSGEGDASDPVGGHSGTAYGGVSFASGEVGQAFKFDGSSGHIRVPDRPDLRFTTAMTVESWINPSDLSGFGSIVVKWDAFLGPNQMAFTFSLVPGGQLSLGVSADGTPNRLAAVTSTNTLSIGQWSHVAGTYDGQALRIYLNGAQVAQVAYNQGIFPGKDDLAIGGVVGGEPLGQLISPFAGLIDEPSLYSRALTPAEILAIYNAGSSGKCKTPFPPFIATEPADQTATRGGTATFSVLAGGSPPLEYQWLFNGASIADATNSVLTLNNLLLNQAGLYSVVVTNAAGSAISSNAVLTVNFPPAAVQIPNTIAQGAGVVTLPVQLVANGNENALGFSLNFDTNFLTFMAAGLGSGAANASLILNTNLVASGNLGLALALAADATFPPGTNEIIDIVFATAGFTNATTTTVTYGDVPTIRQLSDTHAKVLAAIYTGGLVSVAAANFEGDVSPRPDGDKVVTITDWVLEGRYVARLDYPTNASEFQRADCAPRATLGDGQITISDWVQVGRDAAGLDPVTLAGGPTGEGPAIVLHSLAVRHKKDGSPVRQVEVAGTVLIQASNATVEVKLEAEGDENALGFSLSFDPIVLTYAGTILGSDATGATLDINANQAGSGKLGFAFALPIGKSFTAGTKEVIKLTFGVLPSASGTYAVSLGDQPVPREVSDPNAEPLTTSYVSGAIVVNPPPLISVVSSAHNLFLAWPSWATNDVLQATETLLPGSTTWTNVAISPTLTNNQVLVTVPITGATKFYRLSK